MNYYPYARWCQSCKKELGGDFVVCPYCGTPAPIPEPEPVDPTKQRLSDTDLPSKIRNPLTGRGIVTIGDLLNREPRELMYIRNIGAKSVREIRWWLQGRGFDLPESWANPAALPDVGDRFWKDGIYLKQIRAAMGKGSADWVLDLTGESVAFRGPWVEDESGEERMRMLVINPDGNGLVAFRLLERRNGGTHDVVLDETPYKVFKDEL